MEVGTVVGGKYRIESRLGRGGMGDVYVAVQESLGRRVALKVIQGARTNDEHRARFEREAQVVAQLNCPHVVTIFDFGFHEGEPFLAMQLLEGETLRERMTKAPVSMGQALSWARDLACALRSAHDAGIIHRDLKPENVVVVPDKDRGSSAKLLDFGIAKLCAADEVTGLSQLGTVTGTPGYIAPEYILLGQGEVPSVDIYALGVVLYELLAGAPPFAAPTSLSLMMAHARDPVPDPSDQKPSMPSEVAALARRLLSKEPTDRPADGGALVTAIDQVRARVGAALGSATTVDAIDGSRSDLSVPAKPSIAVQPFQGIGGEDDRMFAEGISEDILTALSCFKQLFVIALTSMIRPEGRDTDALRVGRSMGVRYVLQGCVRRGGGRIRVNAKLVDVSSGEQVWAQRYDRDVGDLFAMQDDVTQSIVACVAGRVEHVQAEAARRKPPHTLAAYEWLAKGRALHHRRTIDDNRQARVALTKALELDPDYAQALAWSCCVIGQASVLGDDISTLAQDGFRALARALELDDGDAECHRIAADVAVMKGDLDSAWAHHERALELNPNDARIVGQRGELSLYRGSFEEAAEALEHAARLDPLNPKAFFRHLAAVRYVQRSLDEAARVLKKCDDARPDIAALGAAIAALAGDEAEKDRFLARLKALQDKPFVVSKKPFRDERSTELWREGFVRAGLS